MKPSCCLALGQGDVEAEFIELAGEPGGKAGTPGPVEVVGAEVGINDASAEHPVNRPGFGGGSDPWEGGAMTNKTSNRFSPEVRRRAVRMVLEHGGDHASPWAAIGSIAGKIGCTAETLRQWVRRAERDRGLRPGPTTEERERIKALERENRELRQANEILRKASAYFAQAELDRRSKT